MKTSTTFLTLVLALAFAAPASAKGPASCGKRLPSGKLIDPPTYTALRVCQQRETDALLRKAFKKGVNGSSVAAFKKLEARQRREQIDYEARHPGSMHIAQSQSLFDDMRDAPLDPDLGPRLVVANRRAASHEKMSPEMAAALREFVPEVASR